MSRRGKFVVGGLVIVAAIAYLIWAGVSQSVVYFVTPSELLAAPVATKTYRLGGLVLPGSLKWEPQSLDLSFTLSDGKANVSVKHKGAPPDLFAEGRGRGRRRGVDAGGLLQGLPHPRQALGGVQGSPRRRGTRLQGADQEPAQGEHPMRAISPKRPRSHAGYLAGAAFR